MIYVLKIIWNYRMPLLKLIVHNITRYPQSTASIRYKPVIRYLLAWAHEKQVVRAPFLSRARQRSFRIGRPYPSKCEQ
jgi:hypothetical protein